jgi:two-component system, OmpR family, sensor histidine kinase CreC
MSLRWRLALAVMAITALGFYLLIARTIDHLRPRYQEAMEEAMVDTATILAAWVSSETSGAEPSIGGLASAMGEAKKRELNARIYNLAKTTIAMDVCITNGSGIVLYDSTGPGNVGKDYSLWNDVARTIHGHYGARATRTDPADPRTAILHVAAPILVGGKLIGVVTVGKPVDSFSVFFDAARSNLVFGGVVIALAMVAMAVVVSWLITRPIHRLIRHVQDVKAGRTSVVPELGKHELGELTTAFTDLRAALDGRAYIEQYVQTLTHEMKSPLSAIRGAAELLQEELPAPERLRFLGNIQAETRRLQSLVDMLLQLAALERRTPTTIEASDIDPIQLIDDIIDSLRPLIVAKALVIKPTIAPSFRLRGERFLIRQALANLVLNAIEFSPAGGAVEIEMLGEYPRAEIRVLDQGPGVPAYARERIFERFYSLARPDTGRKGSGLGLTFVREVAALHRGGIALADRAGGGTIATLSLPGDFTVSSP